VREGALTSSRPREARRFSTRRSALLVAFGVVLASVVTPRSARADPAAALDDRVSPKIKDDTADLSGAPRVVFHADRLELDPKLSRLELDGHVGITVDRYWLASDHLVMTRGPLGVLVEGEGRVAFCPCANPLFTFGFRRALVAPPTDLLLTGPTLRFGGAPILWLPYLWIRSPQRLGVLPLRVAIRGSDGFFLGSGVHVPLGPDALDVGLGGYVKGGVEADARLATPRTTSSIRWDYFHQSLLAADLRGALSPEPFGAVTWSVDALRGRRALGGPILLEEAAQRDDRARFSAGYSDGTATAGLSFLADANRGGPIGSVDAYGPGAHAGFGTALGRSLTVDADIDTATRRENAGATNTLVVHHGELAFDGRVGPLAIEVAGKSRATLELRERDTGGTATAAVDVEASLPLVKRWNGTSLPFEHWIVPLVSGTLGVADSKAASLAPSLTQNGGFFTAAAGLRSTLGETAAERGAVSASVRTGIVGEGDDVRAAVAFGAAGRLAFAALRAESVLLTGTAPAALDVAEVRLGAREGEPFVRGRVSESVGTLPLLARAFASGWDAPWVPWLDRPGATTGAGVGMPWTRALATTADADYDASNRTLLGLRGSATYRHPCGCFAVTAWAGHRLGRSGVDSWLTLDLMPPRARE
jgi:hypothetical protein